MPEKKTFFISRAGTDSGWAELIVGVARDAGHEAIRQEDFPPGTSFIHSIRQASAGSHCTIAVLSPAYFKSDYCEAELNAALAGDPNGKRGKVLPVLVERCELPPDVAHLNCVHLIGADEETARKKLKEALLRHGPVYATTLAGVGWTRRAVEQANRNRTAMIEKVRAIWISGLLQRSIFHEARILLGLSERPTAVERPMDLLVKRSDEIERPLPANTALIDVFKSMDCSMLILGAPGSGKTTLLLELARDLLDQAANDTTHPIPVIFPLSTWAGTRKPLIKWLQDELIVRYDVPRSISKEWVLNDQVLPLLDGLDEVKTEHRAECVDSINAFRQSHGFLPLVITSRTSDYEALPKSLRLQGAVLVRPLSPKQVLAYLAVLGSVGAPVALALREDPSLWDLLDSPLLVNVVTVALAETADSAPEMNGTMHDRRYHQFTSYVNQTLRRRAKYDRLTRVKSIHWLSWLAKQMNDRGQTVFYLEGMQLEWLSKKQGWIAEANTLLISGLLGAAAFVPLLVGYGVGVPASGTLFEIILYLVRAKPPFLVFRLVLWIGLPVVGLLLGVLSAIFFISKEIKCTESIGWSWSRSLSVGSRFLLAAVCITGVGGLLVGLFTGLVDEPMIGLRASRVLMQTSGVLFGLVLLIVGLLGGLTLRQIQTRAIPNEGMHRSARNAFSLAVVSGMLLGLFIGLLDLSSGLLARLWSGEIIGVTLGRGTGILVAWIGGLAIGLSAGGVVCLKHLVLRLQLIRNGSTPWNYVKFLDYAADRILLRKVGGGYMFIHRMLLEWFAARYVESQSESRKVSTRDRGLD